MSYVPAPLVGRASLLTTIVRSAREGRGLILTGEPGSGGSRVLAEAHAAARRAGLPSARLLPPPGSERYRVGAFLRLLDHGALEALPARDGRAIRAATVALGLRAVFLDDAHLLDDDAGALVVDLARAGTAIIANAPGTSGMPSALERLIAEERASAVPLEPLAHDDVAELAAHLLGDPVDGELALALALASGGRPRALAELIDDGVGLGSLLHSDGLWRLVAPLPAPRTLRSAVLEAFAALSPALRGWVAAVSLAGDLADDLARRIAAAESIDAADEAGWTVRDLPRAVTRIASPPIGAAVLGSLDARARAAVLRRLVAATESANRPLTEEERVSLLCWRIELGILPDAREAHALALLPGTGSAAREQLLRAAVEGGLPVDAELADHLRRTRRPEEALHLIDTALPHAATEEERITLVRVRALTTAVIERRPEEALRTIEQHLDGVSPHPDLLAVRSAALLLDGRPGEAAETAEGVLASPSPSSFATGFALMQLTLSRRELGLLTGALGTAEQIAGFEHVDRAFADSATLIRWLPHDLRVAVGAETEHAERLEAERERIPLAQRANRCPPLSFTLAGAQLLRADPAAAVRLLRDADAGSGPWRDGWRPRILAELVIAQALAGELDDAAATEDRLRHLHRPPVQHGRVELARAQLAHLRGDPDGARALAAAVASRGRETGLVLDAFDGAFAGIRYGDDEAPRRLLALGDLPEGAGRDAQRAYARALLEGDGAAVDTAAVGLWEAGLRLHAIEATMRAIALGAADASPRLVAWLARTPSLRLPELADRRAAGLTTREREVALLAAAGLSDRAIATELDITLRTAQTHLSRALGKLGIHRRTELPGLVVEP